MGTTVEILAPYLAYGIPLEHTDTGHRRLLTSLELGYAGEGTTGKGTLMLRHFLPVLRPFSALCTPLEDGTIPAVEVAKLFWGDDEDFDWARLRVGLDSAGEVKIDLPYRGSNAAEHQWIDDGWDCGGILTYKAIDYLRSKGFAVGLTPEQFIPKI